MIRNYLFHRVNAQRDILWDPMDIELFDKCIKYISKKYNVVLFEDIAHTKELFNKKGNYATIMFDDGYKDNIENALPILKKYNIKASFYVVTDSIDKNLPTWTHILEHSFQHTKIEEININFDFLPDDLNVETLKTKEERIAYVSILKPFLKKIAHKKRELVLSQIMNKYYDIELPKLMMNWDDLKTLQAEGHFIGSHTVSHNMLGTMADEEEVYNELINSGKRIEEKLGTFPKTISYPVGSFNEATKELSKKAGYKIGLAVKQDVFNPLKEDLFEVSRIELYNESWFKTKMRITNILENIKKIIRYR